MGYSGDDCDTCEDLRREIADLQATVEHKKKECLELIARGDRFFEGQQRVVAQRDELLAACKEARDELRHPDHTPNDWSVQVVLKQLDAAIAKV
jgi:hypothetical protein